jgi:hypothetical protein
MGFLSRSFFGEKLYGQHKIFRNDRFHSNPRFVTFRCRSRIPKFCAYFSLLFGLRAKNGCTPTEDRAQQGLATKLMDFTRKHAEKLNQLAKNKQIICTRESDGTIFLGDFLSCCKKSLILENELKNQALPNRFKKMLENYLHEKSIKPFCVNLSVRYRMQCVTST